MTTSPITRVSPSAGLAGVDGVFVVTSSPESSSRATTSVKVPPVSMPILIRREVMSRFNRRRSPSALALPAKEQPVGRHNL